jgi:hypothetical protein
MVNFLSRFLPSFGAARASEAAKTSEASETSNPRSIAQGQSPGVPTARGDQSHVEQGIHSERSVAPKGKNNFLSGCSQFKMLFQLKCAQTPLDKMAILKNEIINGNLDLSKLEELKNNGKISDQTLQGAKAYLFLTGLRESASNGEISPKDLQKITINVLKEQADILKGQASDEKGLMDILSEQLDINPESEIYGNVFDFCLTSSEFGETPLLVAECRDEETARIRNDPTGNPDANFCKAVMEATNVDTMVEVFATFFENNTRVADESSYGTQRVLYGGASQQKRDFQGGIGVNLKIGEKSFSITGTTLGGAVQDGSAQDFFRKFLEYLEKSEKEGGVGLGKEDALQVLKQVMLAYRGQNGMGDAAGLFLLLDKTSAERVVTRPSEAISLEFARQGSDLVLTQKEEESTLPGIQSIQKNGELITSEVRFKFGFSPDPKDPNSKLRVGQEIRTALPVTSKRIQTDDGTMQWSCPFRENPPTKVIYYGGCAKPPDPTSD